MDESVQSSADGMPIHTYHCICSNLVLASTSTLDSLPTRAGPAQDGALILNTRQEPGTVSTMRNISDEHKAIVVRREDGFEKRTLFKCAKCGLVIGYRLHQAQFGESQVKAKDIVYLLPGGLISTEDMVAKKIPEEPVWAKEKI